MPHAYEYAAVRVVPRVERAEFVNAGVLLHCRGLDFLAARVRLDEAPVLALASDTDLDAVRRELDAYARVCGGGEQGAAGLASPSERFRWLVAPRSTVVQPSPVHTGLTEDPEAELDRLFATLVPARR
ncbi:MAG TPA: DUF3037 domain-containing protein [Jiangellales bacterium]|nr:DUF3037 domain-containing protein [Jiangellales bacterium]